MIYFDNAATTKIDKDVLSSFNDLVSSYFANPASSHRLGQETSNIESMARRQIARLFNAKENEVIFTSGATESNNLAIKGVAFRYQNRGKHLITTNIEHPSVLNAFKQLETFGFRVTYLPCDQNGEVKIDSLEKALSDDTILVSIMAVNNEVGTINDIASMGKLLKKYPKAFFHVDATQAIGKVDIDYKDVDLLSLSAHKLHGFKGSGMLLKRGNIDLMPLASGGGQEFNYRSGTNNFPYEVSLAKTLRLAFEKQKETAIYVGNLTKTLRNELVKIPGIKINTPENASPFILSFTTPKKASVVSEGLSIRDIFVSTKSACSSKKSPTSYVLQAMGRDEFESANAIRVSLSNDNTIEEVYTFIKELKDVIGKIK